MFTLWYSTFQGILCNTFGNKCDSEFSEVTNHMTLDSYFFGWDWLVMEEDENFQETGLCVIERKLLPVQS